MFTENVFKIIFQVNYISCSISARYMISPFEEASEMITESLQVRPLRFPSLTMGRVQGSQKRTPRITQTPSEHGRSWGRAWGDICSWSRSDPGSGWFSRASTPAKSQRRAIGHSSKLYSLSKCLVFYELSSNTCVQNFFCCVQPWNSVQNLRRYKNQKYHTVFVVWLCFETRNLKVWNYTTLGYFEVIVYWKCFRLVLRSTVICLVC